MENFIGRKKEICKLKSLLKSDKSTISIVYGRRRVGKSELISKSLEDANCLFFEGLENQPKSRQINNFLSQLYFQTKSKNIRPSNEEIKEWSLAFKQLIPIIKNKNFVIVLDEFQWMANYRKEIVSDLKMVWDQYLKKSGNITLILCGSIASFMIKKVLKSSAFYGRTDLILHLKPFKLSETCLMLKNRSYEEILETQMLVGGIPKYLELVSKYSSIYMAIQNLAFLDDGYFVEEYDRIFTSHFGKSPYYKTIIKALARNPYGLSRKKISKLTDIQLGGGLTKHLYNLEAAGFINSFSPFDKDHNTKTIRYSLHDPYLRFYFTFIEPNLKKIKNDIEDIFHRISQTPSYFSWIGRAFEYLCNDHAKKIAEILGFPGIDYSFGPYFEAHSANKTGIQIDLLFNRADNVITICEMKYTKQNVGLNVINNVEKKVILLQKKYNKTIQKVLITKSPATKDLINKHYFYKIINAKELI